MDSVSFVKFAPSPLFLESHLRDEKNASAASEQRGGGEGGGEFHLLHQCKINGPGEREKREEGGEGDIL